MEKIYHFWNNIDFLSSCVLLSEVTICTRFRELQLFKNLYSVLMDLVYFEAQFKKWYPYTDKLTEPQNAN